MIKVGQEYEWQVASGSIKITMKQDENIVYKDLVMEYSTIITEKIFKALIKNGSLKLVKDVPSIEEQLKELGIEIEKQEERNNILFYRIDYYSKLRMEWAVRYNYNRKRFVYNTSIGIEQNKLILQYIEDNEND